MLIIAGLHMSSPTSRHLRANNNSATQAHWARPNPSEGSRKDSPNSLCVGPQLDVPESLHISHPTGTRAGNTIYLLRPSTGFFREDHLHVSFTLPPHDHKTANRILLDTFDKQKPQYVPLYRPDTLYTQAAHG